MRLLGGGENPPTESGRELNKCEETCGIEIVLTRLVNNTKLPVFLGVWIRNNLIELAALQGSLIAPIPETQDELSCTSGHINQDNV
jgi:hypothetical protein